MYLDEGAWIPRRGHGWIVAAIILRATGPIHLVATDRAHAVPQSTGVALVNLDSYAPAHANAGHVTVVELVGRTPSQREIEAAVVGEGPHVIPQVGDILSGLMYFHYGGRA